MNRVGEGGQGHERLARLAADRGTRPHGAARRCARCRRAPTRWRAPLLPACARRSRPRLGRCMVPARHLRRWHAAGLLRRRTNAGSTPSRKAGRCCRVPPIPQRAAAAMASLETHLVRRRSGPRAALHPALRQHVRSIPATSRATRLACARMAASTATRPCGPSSPMLGSEMATRRRALFALLNPINHALTPESAARYKVEPYVVAADVYSIAPHEGRGGWTWYTGSAGWMYRAGIEGILGLTRSGDALLLDPCLPTILARSVAEGHPRDVPARCHRDQRQRSGSRRHKGAA